jgi:hypothetical protein
MIPVELLTVIVANKRPQPMIFLILQISHDKELKDRYQESICKKTLFAFLRQSWITLIDPIEYELTVAPYIQCMQLS